MAKVSSFDLLPKEGLDIANQALKGELKLETAYSLLVKQGFEVGSRGSFYQWAKWRKDRGVTEAGGAPVAAKAKVKPVRGFQSGRTPPAPKVSGVPVDLDPTDKAPTKAATQAPLIRIRTGRVADTTTGEIWPEGPLFVITPNGSIITNDQDAAIEISKKLR